ncbi:(Fe-S)-binding protein [Methanosalsum natronophilum]|uniref:(Fe-S)-binding protein n=1 Tax=Methanosalsum natronophilum TaxID=768733 RepID=UPI00216832D5|nr:(Fe-S)-binding protein [Methanosalsum natronophilum]MCS3923920.1 Fe-S oxidoreductase [Methanosalsum natronophilum]
MSQQEKLESSSILKCVRCGTCRSVCPVFEEIGWESKTARGRMLLGQGLIENELEVDEELLESLNMCTTCGICEEKCPAGAAPPKIVETARQMLVDKGHHTNSQEKLYNNTMEYGNSLAEASDRNEWAVGLQPAENTLKSDYVYFVGCLGAYRYPKLARKTYSILRKLGVALLKDEKCCGSPIMRTGFNADKLVSHNLEQIKQVGAHTIISSCAGCYNTFKKNYPDEFRVMHVSEFLEENLSRLNLKPLDIIVTYHDPCHLGRSQGIYDSPRNIIKSICTLIEMKRSKDQARCCGGGGGVRMAYPNLSMNLAKKRVDDFPRNIDYVVTACHLCRNNLIEGGSEIEVIDIVDLICLSIAD